jgi:branched-chain amino acid transport system permease protein
MGMIGIGKINMRKNRIVLFGILVFLLLVPVITWNNDYIMHFFVLCFIWAVVAEAWDLIMGYAGIFSFGQLGFFTIGAFGAGLLTQQLGITPFLALVIAGILTGCAGFLIGLPSLRLRGEYIALITFALHMLLGPLIMRLEFIGIHRGGFIRNIESLRFFGHSFSRDTLLPWYYTGLALFVIFLLLIYRILRSPIGRAFVALRDAEPLAQSLGINEYKYKLIVFTISSFITGVMGAFYAYFVGDVYIRMLGIDNFVKALIMVIFGGLGTFPGPAIGAFIITFFFESIRPLMNYRLIVLGIFVLLIMIFMPGGLMGFPELARKTRVWKFFERIGQKERANLEKSSV